MLGCTEFSSQAELEHRTPKSRYTRTSKKDFTKQLAQIERRQARIRRIRERLVKTKMPTPESVARNPDEPYNIGKSQNLPVNISHFLQKHLDDPAVKVSLFSIVRCSNPTPIYSASFQT
jgi:hypothetical protein